MPISTDTHCPYCALQCGMTLVLEGTELRVTARNFPTNKGGLCRKGWTADQLLRVPGRLTTPLMRKHKGDALQPVSWDDALDRVAGQLLAIRAEHGPDAVGVFGGGGLTNEKAYLLGKFARVALRTANIDYNGRFCMASSAAANNLAFGADRGLPFPLADIPDAGVILIAGGNPAETMPPIMQYFDQQRRRGGKLIVADPRETQTAKAADLHLQLTPGTDTALANGLLHIAIQEGLVDREFIAARTVGFESVRQSVGTYWPGRVERITGVPESRLRAAARLLGKASTAMVLSARGSEQHSHGVDNVLAFINLVLALGKAGKPHCGFGCLTGQGNGQGGREHGQKADQLPGYRRLDNPEHRTTIAQIWGVDANDLPGPGKSACELLDALGIDGGVHALLVFGSNLVVSAPRAATLPERLQALALLVVVDSFLSETAALADVVLPTTQWAEEDGSMTNLEGRVILRRAARPPPEGVWTDTQILKSLAHRLECVVEFEDAAPIIFEELRRASSGGIADYAGISYSRIEAEQGVFWPCPSMQHTGTPRMFLDRFATVDGRARFHAVEHRGAAEEPDPDFPFYLTTGRLMNHYQTGAQTRRIPELAAAEAGPFVEMHPQVARTLGVDEGGLVRLSTRRGEMLLPARMAAGIRLDTLFVPFHWGGKGNINQLTNQALDPISKIPEFKVCAARIDMPASSSAATIHSQDR